MDMGNRDPKFQNIDKSVLVSFMSFFETNHAHILSRNLYGQIFDKIMIVCGLNKKKKEL
jgi:hypothetical protein